MQTKLNKQRVFLKHRILGLKIPATKDAIKQARNRLARRYHPDKNIGADPADQMAAQEKFKNIQSAYDYLMDNYDEIHTYFKHLENYSLTTKGANWKRSQSIYSSVANINNND